MLNPTRGAGVCGVALAVWLTGCASLQADALRERPPAELSDATKLDVPFVAQETHQCGPAALSMVLQHSGVAISAGQLTERIYLPGREGSLQVDMLAAAREQARIAYPLAPRLDHLLREVVAGRPVVVLQNLGLSIAPKWHYAVVIGYDLAREEILLHSGTTPNVAMPIRQFERTWARSGHWGFLVLAPSQLPATAEEVVYVRAAAALERQHPESAREAYATALRAWPTNLAAQMGMGNTAYTLGDAPAAEQAYRAAIRDHPRAADAWNNLAHVLQATGRSREARTAALTAIHLGGPRVERYWQTLGSLPALD
jgi:hypothetical protein